MNEKQDDPLKVAQVAVKRRTRIFSIWLIPLIATLIGGWLFYRSLMEAGVPITLLFSDTADSVLIEVNIDAQYALLVREDSVFWNVSGIGMDVGLFGAKIRTKSLEALVEGGVPSPPPTAPS